MKNIITYVFLLTSFFLLLSYTPVSNSSVITNTESVDTTSLKVKIRYVRNSYVGCGISLFATCLRAEIIDENHNKLEKGEVIHLYLTCPDAYVKELTSETGIYKVKINFDTSILYESDYHIIDECENSNSLLRKIKPIPTKKAIILSIDPLE